METAWIQVFVLTLTQCIAPAGKVVCQEELVQFHFASQEDCDRALRQMVDIAATAQHVIVNEEGSRCNVAAKEAQVFASVEAANETITEGAELLVLKNEEQPADFTQTAHQERLSRLRECDTVSGVAPCKIGEIIIEAASEDNTEIWQQQK